MRTMPVLETPRLRIRPMTAGDAEAVHCVYASIGWLENDRTTDSREEISEYVNWCGLANRQHARLDQPPLGDRAVVLRDEGTLIGVCGLVPYVDRLGVFPSLGGQRDCRASSEVGLFWSISTTFQRRGLATEVARALIDYALTGLSLNRIIATTAADNLASQRVMEKAGMRLERNPFDEPPWLEVLGLIAQE